MIPWDVWSRVVRFSGESQKAGTAFLIGSGESQYLITARHLCIPEPEEVITVRHAWTLDAESYQDNAVRVGMDVAPTADFAVFKLAFPIEDVGGEVPLNFDSYVFGQQAYILGYPYNMSFQPWSSNQQLPIVKSCIVGGMETRGDGVQLLFIDTIVNPGFSGGPLVFIDLATGQPRVAGVVVKGTSGPLHEPTIEILNLPCGPTGIGVVIGELTFRAAFNGGSSQVSAGSG